MMNYEPYSISHLVYPSFPESCRHFITKSRLANCLKNAILIPVKLHNLLNSRFQVKWIVPPNFSLTQRNTNSPYLLLNLLTGYAVNQLSNLRITQSSITVFCCRDLVHLEVDRGFSLNFISYQWYHETNKIYIQLIKFPFQKTHVHFLNLRSLIREPILLNILVTLYPFISFENV